MFKTLIWPSEATTSQAPSEQLTQPISEYVVIVITQRVGHAVTVRASEEISAVHAQLLCIALLEAAPQLNSASQVQRICEDHGAVFTNAVGLSFSIAECVYFYGEDFLIEHYSAIGHWVESRLGELNKVSLDFVEASASLPFAVCMCSR